MFNDSATMIAIPLTNDDDLRFLTLIKRIVASTVLESRPADVFVVRIDHWFDHKWCAFAGKLLGAVAIHQRQRLTIPPFIPGRVLSQDVFTLNVEHTSYHKRRASALHRHQRSGENRSRFIGNISKSGAFAWFSGDTAKTEHGSLMLYSVQGEMSHGWYASFRRGKEWQLNKVQGLSRGELTHMLERIPDEHVS
jgi:hypothetical protein